MTNKPKQHALITYVQDNAQLLKQQLFILLLMTFTVICAALYAQHHPITYTMLDKTTITYAKGEVLDVLDEELHPTDYDKDRLIGQQQLSVKLLEGKFAGKKIEFTNVVGNTHAVRVSPGDHIIVQVDAPPEAEPYFSLFTPFRATHIALFIAFFLLLVVVVSGTKGVTAMIGFFHTIALFALFLIPAVYEGADPVLVTVLTVSVSKVLSLALLNGFCKKTYIAVGGSLLGVGITVIGYYAFSKFLMLNGYNLTDAEELLLIGSNTGLEIKDLLFSSIIISALGAIMDMTMSIGTALCEIYEVDQTLTRKRLFTSGMNMGKDMVGTMTQTLLFALMGATFITMLVVVASGTQFNQFINSDYFSIEVLQGLVGSIAVVLCVPITSGLAALMLARHNK